jgi:uncharacterized membrane-anchored protein YjiN (DUF445 family)
MVSIALSDYDLDRLQALQRARRRATALLVGVAVVFVLTFFLSDAAWVGFLRTTAEASLIGGLADWFAVTALFRHPLGLPIPHTAIIPRSKTGLARSLGEFVRHNFLSPEQLIERLEAARLPQRFGEWLSREDNAATLAGHIAVTLGALAEGLEPGDEPEAGMGELLETIPIARWVGKGAEAAIAEDHHQPLVTTAIAGVAAVLEDNRDALREWVGDESPWWVPQPVDDALFNRAYEALRRFLLDLAAHPEHEVRRTIDQRLVEIARRLQADPELGRELNARLIEMIGRAEGIQELRSALAGHLAEAGRSADSKLRLRMADSLRRLGGRLVTDEQLTEQVETWMRALAGPVARVGQRELADLIAITVDRWDPADTSRRLELWMGRDLQFVRINGTVVGGLAGLAIHTVVVLATG